MEGDEVEYEVSTILDLGLVRGKLHYLVRWKGYSADYDEWRPADELENAKEAVESFHKRHPEAIRDASQALQAAGRPRRRRR